MEADEDGDGKLSFDEFARTVANTVCALVFSVLGVFGQRYYLSLPRRSRVSCVSSVYLPSPCLSPTFHIYLLHFSGYCKANDARRFILDVANARWPLTHFNRLNHSSDQSFYTHISMTPPSPDSSDNHTRLTNILTFVVIFSSTSTPSGFTPLSLTNLRLLEFYTPCSFASFQKQKEKTAN